MFCVRITQKSDEPNAIGLTALMCAPSQTVRKSEIIRRATNRFMRHDATLGQPQPKPRIRVVDLDGLDETVESLYRPPSMQQTNPQIVHQLIALVRTKGVQRSTRVRFHCEHKTDRHSKESLYVRIVKPT
jgi:hypothetical protein